MKKVVLLMAVLFTFVMVLSGCATPVEEPAEETTEEVAEEATETAEEDHGQAPAQEGHEAPVEGEETGEEVSGEIGMLFEQQEGTVVYCTDVPEPGMTFPISTSGDFAVDCYVVDAEGNKISDIEVTDGMIDYGPYADTAVKIIVENGASGNGEYVIPGAETGEEVSEEIGIIFEQQEGTVVYCTDVPEPGMTFPISTSGDFAVDCYVVDAEGNKISDIEVTDGMVDYGPYADTAVKIIVENGASGNGEYVIPAAH